MDGYEFHYPNELSADNLDAVRDALGEHDIYALASGLHLDPRFGKGGLSSPDDAVRDEALAITLEAVDFAGEIGAQFIIWPGVEGYNYPFQTPVRGVLGALRRRRSAPRPSARPSAASRSSSSTRTPSRR